MRRRFRRIRAGRGVNAMLVINGDRSRIPATEKTVLHWLRSWHGEHMIAGVAISGCYIGDHRRRHTRNATEADLVVITPHACVAIEVKGITAPISGELSCPANGPWSMPGITGDPVHIRRSDANPFDQVGASTFNLKNLAKQLGIDAFVSGLVLVLPHPGCTLALAKTDLRTGIDVVVGNPGDLRAWFHTTVNRRASWDAEQAHAVLTALNFGHAVTVYDLIAEGFPGQAAQPADAKPAPPLRQQRSPRPDLGQDLWPDHRVVARAPVRRAIPRSTTPPAWAPIAARFKDRPRPDHAFYPQFTAASPPDFAPPPKRRWPRQSDGQMPAAVEKLAAIGVIAILICGFWLFVRHSADPAPARSTEPELTQASFQAPPAAVGEVPGQQTPPPASRGIECFPFQSGCS